MVGRQSGFAGNSFLRDGYLCSVAGARTAKGGLVAMGIGCRLEANRSSGGRDSMGDWEERNWTSASKALGYAALGFVIANPVLLFHPLLYREAMLVAWEPWVVNIYTIFRMLFSTCWEWDGVPSGGIFVHDVSLLTVIMIVDLLWSEGKKDEEMRMAAKGFLCTWGITLVLVLRNRLLLWYAFPALAIVPFGLLYLTKRSQYDTAAVICKVLFGAPLARLKHLAAQSRHNSMILFKAVGSIAEL